MGGIGAPKSLLVKGKRLDGRKLDEVRPVSIEVGIIPNADGSCMFRIGGSEILAAVYGPREMFPRRLQEEGKAHINCIYDLAPFSTSERNRPGPGRRSKEISEIIAKALTPAVMLEKYPRTGIDVYLLVSNAHAGTRCAAICAASVALADAGIEMRDMVASIASGKFEDKIGVDLFNPEDNYGQADVPLAIMPNSGQITLLQMDGDLTKAEFKQCLDFNFKACMEIYKKQIEDWLSDNEEAARLLEKTMAEIKNILAEFDAKMAQPGAVTWAFEKKGAEFIPKYPLEISDESAKGKLEKFFLGDV